VLYNSFQFLFIFLPACLLLYFLAARFSAQLANVLLAVMSFVFYGVWDWHNLIIHRRQHRRELRAGRGVAGSRRGWPQQGNGFSPSAWWPTSPR